ARTVRLTICPRTGAASSPFFSAWIFPLAGTLETISSTAAFAVVTRGIFRSRAETCPAITRTTSTAATAITIFQVRDIGFLAALAASLPVTGARTEAELLIAKCLDRVQTRRFDGRIE